MAVDNKQIATDVLELVGGAENVTVATNCMTRLRLTLKDNNKADVEKIKHYVINPVEAREAGLEEVDTLQMEVEVPTTVETITGFTALDEAGLAQLLDKLGLGRQTLTTAPYKDAGSMLEPLTADEKAYFQGVLKDMHEQFVDIVAQGRHMDRTRAARLATSKIFTGREAVELGLVDELGGQQAAHRWLADVCKVPADRPLLTPPSEDEWWEKSLKTWFGLDADALLGREAPAFLYSF